MACPFFLPASPLAGFSDDWNGECARGNGSPIPADLLRSCCNRGYARKICTNAATSESDAFRFFIKAHCDGAVHVSWSSERDHHPVAVGSLSIQPHTVATTPLETQALRFAADFLRQIGAGN